MAEQNELLQLPLVAPVYTPTVRAGLRAVLFGLTQYVYLLADNTKEKELCFEALDKLVTRFQVGPVEDLRIDDNEIGQVLEAMKGFLFTLYHFQPPSSKDNLRLFIIDWCGRLKMQVEEH